MPAAAIHYFSGTGNTHRAARITEGKLRGAGYAVDVYRVSEGLEPAGRKYDLQVFAYPVYALDVPNIMLQYMRKLQPDSARAAVITIFGDIKPDHMLNGFEGNALARAVKVLRSKGYDVFFTDATGYPASITFGINPPAPADQEAIRAKSDKKVEAMAAKIAGGSNSYRRVSLFNPAYAAFGAAFRAVGRRALGKMYVADDGCIGCDKCVRSCPAGAIRLVGKTPRWGISCEGCQRCINTCPKHAIQTSIVRLLGVLFLQIASLITFIALFFVSYGDYFPDITLGPLQIGSWWVGFGVTLVTWALVFLLLSRYVLDELIWIGERTRALRPIFTASFTRGYRRYLDPGFDPLEPKGKASGEQ